MKIEPNWHSISKIVACSVCNSSGIVSREELVDYHKGDYDVWNELCSGCDGEGRIIETTHSFRIEFNTPDSKTTYTNSFKDYSHISVEKLGGRKTSDIYKIGRKK